MNALLYFVNKIVWVNGNVERLAYFSISTRVL